MRPGTIVRARDRLWVLLPSDDPDYYWLRPLAGLTDDAVALYKPLTDLLAYTLPEERLSEATFPPPKPDDVSDAVSARLLWQAARLTLREGAAPFRSLGRISIRPRLYQFVPLLMALRLDPVRLLIADDVGVGKTIEALLIARELFDRGEIRRMCVLCPPHLCDQWERELAEKFNLEAVVIRSGTIGQLERGITQSVYEHYPVQVISIDFVKSERNRHRFLLNPPEFIIVDEAHGCAAGDPDNQNQQQRHSLVKALAEKADRHLVLLTATPHSGIEGAFRSLLALLDPKFGAWDTGALTEAQRDVLARHFVQRTRRDIEKDWEGAHCFPIRESADETYPLSPAYRDLFEKAYAFCAEAVDTGQKLDKRRQRVRYWDALALLRCVMSSPAAAVAALEKQQQANGEWQTANGEWRGADGEEEDLRAGVFESSDDRTDDEQPTLLIASAESTLDDRERRRLRELARLARSLLNSPDDTKVVRCAELVKDLLAERFNPIVWCRYVATAEYVGEYLRRMAPAQVVVITGRMSDEERRARIEEIDAQQPRMLVATDCLSEGINLQEKFNAALHYDLPWNPNRLEQREGRVDRYGQPAPKVKTIRFFSPDSPIDGVVIEVLLNKAREIYRALGTHVPVPEESESVIEAVLNALFLRPRSRGGEQLQLDLGLGLPQVAALHAHMEADAERERTNRTRFAQRAIKAAEVGRELEAVDSVLGDPQAVRDFVLNAAQRLGLTLTAEQANNKVYRLLTSPLPPTLPEAVRLAIPGHSPSATRHSPFWRISFESPTPEGVTYLGRNHPFVAGLARFLLEEALRTGASEGGMANREGRRIVSRCGVIATRAVSRPTWVLLLRVRYLIEQPERPPLLAEEVLAAAFEAQGSRLIRLPDDAALRLLHEAQPDANIPLPEKRALAAAALDRWPEMEAALESHMQARAGALTESYKRVRRAAKMSARQVKMNVQLPADLLGLLVLHPVVTA
jgi:superfamily II DNA or RNA helicase